MLTRALASKITFYGGTLRLLVKQGMLNAAMYGHAWQPAQGDDLGMLRQLNLEQRLHHPQVGGLLPPVTT